MYLELKKPETNFKAFNASLVVCTFSFQVPMRQMGNVLKVSSIVISYC